MEKEILKLVGARIRDLRKSKSLSQEALGEKAGFSYSYLGAIERGKKNMSLINMSKIANALDVEVYQLFDFARQYNEITETEVALNNIMRLLLSRTKADLAMVQNILQEIFDRLDNK